MQAAPARRPYGVLPPDGMDAARRVGMEVRLRTVHTRHRYPVWRNSSRGGVSDTRFPYGGLPPEGTESCLRTVRMEGELQTICTLRQPPAARVLYYSASIAIANNVGTGANLL